MVYDWSVDLSFLPGVCGFSLKRTVSVIVILLIAGFAVLPAQAGVKPAAGLQSSLVVLADPQDPYYVLAEEIGRAESCSVAPTLAEALDRQPVYLLWVISPSRVTEQRLSDFGLKMLESKRPVSTGIITGGTMESARALWQRKIQNTHLFVSVVPREQRIAVWTEDRVDTLPVSRENLIDAARESSYLTYHGHGTPRLWRLDETTELTGKDLPNLPPLFVDALACQTLKIQRDESIALSFIDHGAAGYVGFVHSPLGYTISEGGGFPYGRTWPDLPVGHVVRLQNRALLQGSLAWPYYLLLGDPRLSFQSAAPYQVVEDREEGDVRTLRYTGTPAGILPVRIPSGAGYSGVEVPGVAVGWEREPFYNNDIQMIDVGPDKYLLLNQPGGDVTVRLYRRTPVQWLVISPLVTALDYTTTVAHLEGSIPVELGMSALLGLVMVAVLVRRKARVRGTWPGALLVGVALLTWRGGYALLRYDALSRLFASRIRTMDVAFDVNWPFLAATFLLATVGALLFFDVRSRLGRALIVLAVTFSSWTLAAFWLAVVVALNVMAQRAYGTGLYGYGGVLMPLIAFVVEAALVVGVLATVGGIRRVWGGV